MNNQQRELIQWNKVDFHRFRAFLDECQEIIQSDVVKNMSCAAIVWNTFQSQSSHLDRARMARWGQTMVSIHDTSHEEASAIIDFIAEVVYVNIVDDLSFYWRDESSQMFALVKEADDYRGLAKVVKELREEYHTPKPIVNKVTTEVKQMIEKAEKIKKRNLEKNKKK